MGPSPLSLWGCDSRALDPWYFHTDTILITRQQGSNSIQWIPNLYSCLNFDTQKRIKNIQEFRKVHVMTMMNMASSVIVHNMSSIPLNSPKCYKNENLTLTRSQFLSSKSLLNLSRPSLLSTIHIKNRTIQSSRSAPSIVFAAQSNFLKGKLHSLFFFFFGMIFNLVNWSNLGLRTFLLFLNWFHLTFAT